MQMRLPQNKVCRLVITYAPGTVLPTLLGLLSSAVFTRVFSTFDYGRYSLMLSVSMLSTTILSQWVQQAINRFIPGHQSSEELSRYKQTVATILALIVVLVLVLVAVFAPFASWIVPAGWAPLLVPGIALILSTTLFNVLLSLLQASMLAGRYTVYNVAGAVLKFLLSLLMVMCISRHVSSLIWGAAIGVAILIPSLWKKADLPPVSFSRKAAGTEWIGGVRSFATYGLPMTVWYFAANLLNFGDRYVIQWFRGASEVGIYTANYTLITGAVGLLAMPITLTVHPMLMKSWNCGDKESTSKWLGIIVEVYSMIGILLVGTIWLFSNDIAEMFLGQSFREGSVILPIVIAGVVIWQLGTYTHKPFEFTSKTRVMMFLALLSVLINMAIDVVFVPRYGYIAAAYSTLVSYSFYTVTISILGQRLLRWKMNWPRIAKNTAITASCLFLIKYWKDLACQNLEYGSMLCLSLALCAGMVLIVAFSNQKLIKSIL